MAERIIFIAAVFSGIELTYLQILTVVHEFLFQTTRKVVYFMEKKLQPIFNNGEQSWDSAVDFLCTGILLRKFSKSSAILGQIFDASRAYFFSNYNNL